MLLGLTGAGKSRLGNKLSGDVNFIESDGSDSCTKKVQRAINQFGVEIIDSQGLADTNKEDKDGLISIFSEIKEKRPNVLAYVQNASDKRFGEASEKAISMINDIVREVEVGEVIKGKVVRIMKFGAFVDIYYIFRLWGLNFELN